MQLQFSNKQIVWLSLLCFSAIAFPVTSQAITVQEVPNPRQVNNTWVTDKANILSDSTETQLNQMISDLEAKNGSEIAVVTVADTKPSATPKAFATELFNSWAIGKKGKNNGVLLLISSGERRVQIETGSGIQSILPDAKAVGIIKTEITPRFKQQDFDGGTLAGTKALVNVLQTWTVNAQSQTTLPLAPIVPSQGVKPSPISSQSPVISNSSSTGEDSSNPIYDLLGLLFIAFIAFIACFIIFRIFRSLFYGKSPSASHRRYPRNYSTNNCNYSTNSPNYSSNNRNYSSNSHNYCGGAGDYSSNSIDYSSSSNYSINSSSGDCGGDYSTNSSDYSISSSDCGGSFGGGESSGGGGGGDYSISSSDCGGSFGGGDSSGGGGGGDYRISSSDYSSSSSSDYSSSSSSDYSSSSSSDYSSSSSSDYSSSSSSDSSSGGGGGDW